MLKFSKMQSSLLIRFGRKLRILFLMHMADRSGETAHTSKDSLEIRQCDCCCFSTSTKKTRNLFLSCFPFINTFLLRSGLTLLAHCMWYERVSEYFTRHKHRAKFCCNKNVNHQLAKKVCAFVRGAHTSRIDDCVQRG